MADAMIELFRKVHSVLAATTLDNGSEFVDHGRVAKETWADVYFAKTSCKLAARHK